MYHDHARTIESLRAHNDADADADADGFEQLYKLYKRFAPHLFALSGCALPSGPAAREVVRLLRRQGLNATLSLAQTLLMSTRQLGETWFATPEAQAMAACWGMHIDFSPDVSGGAMFPSLSSSRTWRKGCP